MHYTIENDGKKYDYEIKQLKAWAWSDTLFNLTQMVTGADKFSAKTIVAAVNTLAQTGAQSDVKPDQISEAIMAFQFGKFELLIDLVIGIINSSTEDKRLKVFDSALSSIWFNNGNPAMGGGFIQLSLDNIDQYITHPVDMMLLVKESLMLNYKSVFDRFFNKPQSTK